MFYRFADRNRYGFRTKTYRTFMLTVPAGMVLVLALRLAVWPRIAPAVEIGYAAEAAVFVILAAAYRITGVRRGCFAPAVLVWRDPLLPRNDLECWCAATFAIWAHSFLYLEGWPLMTGSHRSRSNVEAYRESALRGQWEIVDRAGGLETVHSLTAAHAGCTGKPYAGWDLCRATQLLGMMYMVKMIDREELDRELSEAGRVIQRSFGSWDEMTESYLRGYEAWCVKRGNPHAIQAATQRRAVCRRLRETPYGPYTIPWETDLSWEIGKERRISVRRILGGYRALSEGA